ncbi:MAG: Dabb family protein [Actinobacteria bacterium]|nr:Dabb family protein [Actinomycetota bacterium]
MFRLICLVRVHDNADVDALVAGARQMVADEPKILRGEVMPGLGKMKEYVDHASYSLLMDFASEEDWTAYIAGEPHRTFHELAIPFVKHIVVTQYELPD